jgi:DNA-binding helix-hairpin-helix protein with protein kinase domain
MNSKPSSISPTAFPAPGKRRAARRGMPKAWLTAWLVIGVWLVQLVAMEFHHHPLFDIDNDCPSCQLDAMHPAPAPSTPVAAPVPVRSFSFHVAVEPALSIPSDIRSYLSPYPQAPPSRLAAQA